jgi:YD repeat-containing protein
VTRVYDAAGRLASITDWLTHKTTFTVDADSNVSAIGYANGVTATSVFDRVDQLTSITHKTSSGSTLASFTYTRDPNGQLLSTTPTGADHGSSETYSYTKLNQPGSAHSRKATLFTFRPCEPVSRLVQGLAYGKTCRARTAGVGIRASRLSIPDRPEYPGMRRADRASETHAQTQLPACIGCLAALPCGSRSDGAACRPALEFKPETCAALR